MDSILANGHGHFRDHLDPSKTTGGTRQSFLMPKDQQTVHIPIVHEGFEFPIQLYR